MNRINKVYTLLSTTIVLLSGAIPAAHAVDILCNNVEGNVHLLVPGLFYEAYLERAESPDGPYTFISHGSFGCTQACEFMDRAVVEGTTYWYQMTVLPQYGPLTRLGPAQITTPALPRRVFASVATPNPFPEVVSIRFRVPAQLALQSPLPVRVRILDATGRAVRDLSGAPMTRGDQAVQWDGRDRAGRKVPSGAYLYVIEAGGRRETGRLLRVN
jgi:hypothetical protein